MLLIVQCLVLTIALDIVDALLDHGDEQDEN